MERKIFNPGDWLKDEEPAQEQHTPSTTDEPLNAEVEYIIQQIEEKKLDIAAAYQDWRNIGFAFADAFGEAGRTYFHRISCFYSDYTKAECDQQFDRCLKAK